jgi:uncharacterized protein YkwD
MTRIPFAGLLAAAWAVSVTTAATAQDAHTEDVEVIKTPAVPDDNPTPDLAAVSRSIVERTNAFRKEQGLGPAAVDDNLKAAAEAFAAFMAREDRYGHTADGDRPAGRAKAHGYAYCIVLENIAYAFDPAGFTAEKLTEEFVTGWKESPGHRKNMLDPDVTETGVAVGRSKKTGYYYAVQMFGRPKSQAIEFEVENRADEAFDYVLGGREYSLPPEYTRTHTVCRPPAVAFRWPGGKKGADEKREPGNGDRLDPPQVPGSARPDGLVHLALGHPLGPHRLVANPPR